jgi:hypothetical protein
MTRALMLLILMLLFAAPAAATHPAACTLDLGPVPVRTRDQFRCLRRLKRVCKLCDRFPGMTLCVTGACDLGHACLSYTPTAADCAVGHYAGCTP